MPFSVQPCANIHFPLFSPVRDFSKAQVTLAPAEYASWSDARSEMMIEMKRCAARDSMRRFFAFGDNVLLTSLLLSLLLSLLAPSLSVRSRRSSRRSWPRPAATRSARTFQRSWPRARRRSSTTLTTSRWTCTWRLPFRTTSSASKPALVGLGVCEGVCVKSSLLRWAWGFCVFLTLVP